MLLLVWLVNRKKSAVPITNVHTGAVVGSNPSVKSSVKSEKPTTELVSKGGEWATAAEQI